MLIHRITRFPYQGVDSTEDFGRKTKEKQLVDKMKSKFGLVKKSCRYSIISITDKAVQFSTRILACKIMRKCHADKVLTSIISLAVQCAKGV